MIRWLVAKFGDGIYTKQQALVIAFSTISLWAGMCFAVVYGIYWAITGTGPPLPTQPHGFWPYD